MPASPTAEKSQKCIHARSAVVGAAVSFWAVPLAVAFVETVPTPLLNLLIGVAGALTIVSAILLQASRERRARERSAAANLALMQEISDKLDTKFEWEAYAAALIDMQGGPDKVAPRSFPGQQRVVPLTRRS